MCPAMGNRWVCLGTCSICIAVFSHTQVQNLVSGRSAGLGVCAKATNKPTGLPDESRTQVCQWFHRTHEVQIPDAVCESATNFCRTVNSTKIYGQGASCQCVSSYVYYDHNHSTDLPSDVDHITESSHTKAQGANLVVKPLNVQDH